MTAFYAYSYIKRYKQKYILKTVEECGGYLL